ncbi:hypothetical protein LV84_03270 [Algoriphagus ratkowskyi]|uniref:BNR repeat protein n=1 Tax=Algoriphagus ratkowskyi TaxID=57028 RepID=A0A2W7R1E8_9BACT|nr:hypothetical protein [Algoriphagus ratkowskyi]PZX53066.1 hypothetical protein LV84_03270 [Algoriphagus ratkowskyi]
MENITKVVALLMLVLAVSCKQDKADTLTSIPFPDGEETSLPYLFSGIEGLMMSWVKMVNDSTAQLKYSRLEGSNWVPPKVIVEGTDWFVNWADFPSITENNGNLLTHFLEKSSKETFSYDVKLNLLPKGVTQWRNGLQLHNDSTKTEHGFVSVLPYQEDSFFVAWLDGRGSGASMNHGHDSHGGSMSIRAATVSSDGTISNESQLDAKTCDCCQTTAAITDNGPIVIYRDRSDEEVRDIAITRYVNGQWTTPKIIHEDGWKINGCPVNGPKADAKGNSLVVTWFTGVNNKPVVNVAFSTDGGENFGEPIQVSGLETLGRVDVAILESNMAVVSWVDTENGKNYLKAMKVESSGKMYTPVLVTEMDPVRKSGFPQMEKLDDKLYFAWTDILEDIGSVKTAFISISSL